MCKRLIWAQRVNKPKLLHCKTSEYKFDVYIEKTTLF